MSNIFYFSSNDSPSKTMKNVYFIWKALFIEIFKFLYFHLPLFFCLSAKVYDVINCLNKNFITHFAWYIKKERRHDIETLSVDRVLDKEHFVASSCKKCAPKTIPRLFLILLNNSKQPLCARNSFKIKIFWKTIIKKP